ncbi:hypothetical protein [Picosynechococcus sp. NKBG15041c]|nr:hypothetical protein [Picosynechococcus sp. NKBG15041c]
MVYLYCDEEFVSVRARVNIRYSESALGRSPPMINASDFPRKSTWA